jgi:polysaccharide chain length determinant protein (PEP-CTERM system associated)
MLPGRRYTPELIVRLAWRHRWLLLVPTVVVGSIAVVTAARLPDVYRSETLILIEPQRIPTEYVRSTVSAKIEDRLQSISQQIMSRTRLEIIINDFNLYPGDRRLHPMEDVILRMRRDIEVQTVSGADAFRVAYQAGDPMTAMKVTNRLAALFIDENLKDREVLASGTSNFLESQLEDARQRLVVQEKALEKYRLEHSGELPSQLPSNMQAIQSAQMQVQSLVESINRDRDRKLIVERMLADESAQAVAGQLKPLSPGTSVPADAPTAVRLESAKQELAAALTHLRDAHPEVVALRATVADLEAKLKFERDHPSQTPAAPITASEVLQRNRLQDLRAELQNLDGQVAFKQQEEKRLRGVIADYQTRVQAVPARESELTSLTRDYETLQNIYRGLLQKREDSKIAENLERRQVGEQFKVLDPARRPERPFKPNRWQIDFAGAFAGLLLGVGLGAFVEYRDKTMGTETDVKAALSLPVLALIPVMQTDKDARRARRRRAIYNVAGAIVLLVCVAAVVAVLF